mgnify:CR=1 FL=1
MKFTIGQRVRFYVSREFLEGQDLSAECSPGWITGKITEVRPVYESCKPVQVTLDSKTGVLPKHVNTLNFTKEGNFYMNMHNRNEGEQLTLWPLTILKRRHL